MIVVGGQIQLLVSQAESVEVDDIQPVGELDNGSIPWQPIVRVQAGVVELVLTFTAETPGVLERL